MRLVDITGKRFGRLIVLRRGDTHVFPSGQTCPTWVCICDCGNEVTVLARNLITGNTTSCGCRKRELQTKHGQWGSKAYRTWDRVRQRCYNPKSNGYKYWGGRGIKMYAAWINDPLAFCEYISKLPHFGESGRTLDRIDNDGDYVPNNLRWATKSEQNANKRYRKGFKLSEEHKRKISESVKKSKGDKE